MHLFFHCSYASQVIPITRREFHPKVIWNGCVLDDCFRFWFLDMSIKIFQGLPCFYINCLWRDQTLCIFQDRFMRFESYTTKIISLSKEFILEPKKWLSRSPQMPELGYDVSWVFFDGVSRGHPPHCGVCVVLYFNILILCIEDMSHIVGPTHRSNSLFSSFLWSWHTRG